MKSCNNNVITMNISTCQIIICFPNYPSRFYYFFYWQKCVLSSTLSLALTTTLCFASICKQTFDCAPLFLSVLSSSSCSSMAVSKLEPELRDSIRSQYGDSIRHVYFNKGLWGQEGWLEFSIRRTRLNSCVSISWPKSVIINHNEMLLCSFFFFITFSNWCLSLDVCCGTFDQCCHLILTLITTVWIPAEKPNDLLSGTICSLFCRSEALL